MCVLHVLSWQCGRVVLVAGAGLVGVMGMLLLMVGGGARHLSAVLYHHQHSGITPLLSVALLHRRTLRDAADRLFQMGGVRY